MNRTEMLEEARKLAEDIIQGRLDEEDESITIAKFAKILPLTAYFSLLIEFNSPAKEMDSQSAMFGYILGIQSALFFPEWARAFSERHIAEQDDPPSEEDRRESLYERFIKLTPLSVEVEPPNAN